MTTQNTAAVLALETSAHYQTALINLSDELECEKTRLKLLKAAKKAGKLAKVTRQILQGTGDTNI
jgi:hypothetical protein